jgi:hypothetical protein
VRLVSLRQAENRQKVCAAFCTGTVDPGFLPHVHASLEEAPVSLLARVVEELHAQAGVPHSAVWHNMRQLARRLQCGRALWQ